MLGSNLLWTRQCPIQGVAKPLHATETGKALSWACFFRHILTIVAEVSSIVTELIGVFSSFRYIVCKGLRGNSQAVHEHMFNVNVRINRLKAAGVEDVNEVSAANSLIKIVCMSVMFVLLNYAV